MKVTLKLYASLGDYLPPGTKRNQIEVDVQEQTSIRDLLERHHVPMETCHLILVNGVYTAPAMSHTAELKNGDVVAVWPPIAGG